MKLVKLGMLLTLALSTSPLALAAMNLNDWARDQYESLNSPEMRLSRSVDGSRILGVELSQKNREDGSFCRKSQAVVPGAKPAYACYHSVADGEEAREIYESAEVAEVNVSFSIDGQLLVGARHLEKQTLETEDEIALLCVKTGAVVPNPKYSYSCYVTEFPLGSGVSVGN